MKRSHMLEYIAERLLTTVGLYGGAPDEWEEVRESNKMSRLKIAHAALSAAEDKGMLLPPYNANRGNNVGIPYYYVCEWESENDV